MDRNERIGLSALAAVLLFGGAGFASGRPWAETVGWLIATVCWTIAAVLLVVVGVSWRRARGSPRPLESFTTYPFDPPLDYQVRVLRQLIVYMSSEVDRFQVADLPSVLERAPRTGKDRRYEPISPYLLREGLDQLTADGELEYEKGRWRIVQKT